MKYGIMVRKSSKKRCESCFWYNYGLHANALDVCELRREQHSLKFAQSLPECSWTSKLLRPCRGLIHGRQLQNNAKRSRPCAHTNRYAIKPIPYYVQLINTNFS